MNGMDALLSFMARLSQGRISYTLAHNRDEAIMVLVAVPGERWEVEFFADGDVQVEVFVSDGKIRSAEALEELFAKHSDVDS